MKFVRVPVVMILPPSLETLSNCRFIVGVESQIPLLTSSIFFEWAGILRIQEAPLFVMFPQVNSALEQRYFLTLHKL